MAVRQKKIFPAIVIEVEESHAEAKILPVDAQPGLDAGVFKSAVAIVAVQRGHLFGEVCSRNIQPAIAIEICHSDTHSGEGDSIFIQSATGRYRDFPERPIVIVAIKQAGSAVAGNVNIGPSVVVEVGRRRSHAVRTSGLPIPADTKTIEEGPRGRAMPDSSETSAKVPFPRLR